MYAENLKKLRKKLRYSIDVMANLLEIPSRTLGGYERSERIPSIDLATRLRNKLNVNLNWFVSGEGQMFNAPKFEDVEDVMEAKVMAILRKQGVIE
ncbi:helix-turn-helix transcriptional regulator [bacterium]|nr:helix-turn-helix transcriptional regulator [bacterium]